MWRVIFFKKKEEKNQHNWIGLIVISDDCALQCLSISESQLKRKENKRWRWTFPCYFLSVTLADAILLGRSSKQEKLIPLHSFKSPIIAVCHVIAHCLLHKSNYLLMVYGCFFKKKIIWNFIKINIFYF
jgi:hypothetical protein